MKQYVLRKLSGASHNIGTRAVSELKGSTWNPPAPGEGFMFFDEGGPGIMTSEVVHAETLGAVTKFRTLNSSYELEELG